MYVVAEHMIAGYCVEGGFKVYQQPHILVVLAEVMSRIAAI
jgi:hypothetical protein